jgi:ligand-binding sensor domain-containing protein
MISRAFLLTVLLLPFSVLSQISQVNNLVGLSHILSETGLSQNTVHSIIQDKKGFIWFATEDGLNRYDGYSFTIFKYDPHDKNSIADNFIWTIYEDRNGTLWAGTNSGGLCRFNYEKENFLTYRNIPGDTNSLILNNVRAVYEDSHGNIWVGTENGLDKFDSQKNIFIHYKNDPGNPESISNNVILSIFEDKNNVLWIGSDGGLDRYNEALNSFTNYSFDMDVGNSSSVILSIYQDENGLFWIGTLKGLISFDKKTGKYQKYYVNESETNSINSNRINIIIEPDNEFDNNEILWVGTGDGLFVFNKQKKEFTKIKPAPSGSTILKNNNVLSLFEDKSGLIWIGTAEDGVVKYDEKRLRFKHYKHDPFNSNSLNYNTIRALFQDEDRNIWIGTLGGGLNLIGAETGKFYYYKNNPKDKFSLSDNSISAVFKDSFGYIWLGTWGGGLNKSTLPVKKHITDLKFINYKNNSIDPKSIRSNIIQAVYEDSYGRIWIGTGTGLSLYNKENNEFINFFNDPANSNSLSSNQVQSCIIEDRKGNLWVGTWNGLNKLSAEEIKNAANPQSVKFKRYRFQPDNQNSLSDERVISAYEDNNGNLWFGTYGGGLNFLSAEQQDSENAIFTNYSFDDGLASNIIYRILGDEEGNLWMSTDNGLSMLDPVNKIIKNYDASDGLQGNQFFWGAGFKGVDGELFFGGTNGFNVFKPEDLKNNNYVPPVLITDFQIFNKPVEIDKENSPLKQSILFTKEIELLYSQRVFSFEYAALDYTVPGKNRYAYMMEGFDKDWINSGNRRYVTYTNLDPGEYIFKVKGSNNDGIWNEEGVSLTIKILPPLWRTWWFISFAVIIFAAIIISIIYFRVRHLLDIERLRTKLAADLHDNIGSSLTEISILSEVISKKIKTEDESIRKSLGMISTNSRNLIDNMSDIVWLVNPKRDSLYDLILRLRDTYSELSSYTSISFKSENIKSLEKVSLKMEHRQHLYLIFKEAINNCITHSGCSEITLDASVKGGTLLMTIKDNGKGFFPDEISGNGNGLNNMKNRAKIIGGNLKISSEVGAGSTIQFEGNIL